MNGDHQQKRTIDKLKRELGQAILAPLYDPDVIEVMVNSDSSLWIEKLDQEPERLGAVNPSARRAVIGTVASSLGSVATVEKPIVEGELPLDGSRFADATGFEPDYGLPAILGTLAELRRDAQR